MTALEPMSAYDNNGRHHEEGAEATRVKEKRKISSPLWVVCHRLQSNWKVILLGQFLSFLLASAGAAQATLHLNCGLSAPTFTMSLVYLGLLIIHMPILLWRRMAFCGKRRAERLPTDDSDAIAHRDSQTESMEENIAPNDSEYKAHDVSDQTMFWSLRWYFLLAFFDVEANAITMLAFRYTTLTSVTLFDALAIPASMFISRCIVFRSSRRYRPLHYIGALVCMVGIVLNVLQDYESESNANEDDQKEYPHKLWGDLCAIAGGILYGLNDVLTEVTVSKALGTTEYLGMLGACGFLISLVQSLWLERDDIRAFFPSDGGFDSGNDSDAECSLQSGFLLLFAFVGVTMCSYIGASHFLILSEAAFFNLSLLTGDLWSVLFSVVAERIIPQPLFFAALAAVLSGVVVYEMAPSPALEKDSLRNVDRNSETAYSDESEDRGNGKDGVMRDNHRRQAQDMERDGRKTDFAGVELNTFSIHRDNQFG